MEVEPSEFHPYWHCVLVKARVDPRTLPAEEAVIDGVLRDVLALVIRHNLSHQTDDSDLSLAIELLKAIRDDPTHIAVLYERFADDFLSLRHGRIR